MVILRVFDSSIEMEYMGIRKPGRSNIVSNATENLAL